VRKARAVHGNRYNYSNVNYVDCKTKVEIICKQHGSFIQLPNAHNNSGAGCPKCGNDVKRIKSRKSPKQFILDATRVHGNLYDYTPTKYTTAHNKVDIRCKTHGIFSIVASQHINGGSGCPTCGFTESKAERYIKQIFIENGINFTQQDRSIIKPLELDFVLPDHKLAIEFNGIFYHTEHGGGKNKKYHLNKTIQCGLNDIQLIHIFEDEYIDNPILLKSKIKNLLGLNRYRIFARKCEIREISPKVKKQFNEKYHMQGDSQSSVNLGLYYNRKLIQVMTFSKKRVALGSKAVAGSFELSRMCSIKNFNIVGGASKLLKYFENNYNPTSLISYSDKRWGVGKVYYNLGFDMTHESPPNYWYIDRNKPTKRYHRYNFAKHTLSKKLKTFNPNISEWENMKLNNYDRIWDCGNMVFEKLY